jgi:putative oxidoreductase
MARVYATFVGGKGAVGLLVLRLVMGAAFALHGWPKVQNPFAWMGPQASVPGFLQGLAALAEFGGGLALVVGLLTPLASFGIACTMIVAVGLVHVPNGHPFVGKPGGPSFELAAVYLAAAVAFLLVGPGEFSLDALLFGRLLRREDPADALTVRTEARSPHPIWAEERRGSS